MLELFDYQLNYIRKARPNWLYDCDTGVGKTVMGLAHYRAHFSDAPLAIVAPASKIKEGGWQRTLEQMCPNKPYKICSYNKLKNTFESLFGHFIIFDECHRLKDSCGVWGKAAYKICTRAKGFIMLSATPIPNSWEDAINYFKIFGLIKNKTTFINRFALYTRRYGYFEVIGWRNEHKIKAMWQSISKRLNKEDCIDLPPIVFKDVFFEQSREYKKILKTRVLDGVSYDCSMSWRHALRKFTSPHEKNEYLKDFLESTTQNVVIFYNYKYELELLKKSIKDKIIYECNGQTKNLPPYGTKIKNTVTLANYKSGSEGVEFTYANIIIYFSPTESYTEFYQSYGRCHRLNQDSKVTVYQFKTHNTIEVDIYDALQNKRDFVFDLWEAKIAG